MPTFKLSRKQALGIKTEATQSVAVVPSTSTDYILVENVDVKIGKETLERDYKRSTLDSLASVTGKRWAEVSFTTELKNGGTAGTVYAPLDAALKACGWSGSVSASNSVLYRPMSDAPSTNFYGPAFSSTMEGYRDGHKWIVKGSVGSFKIDAQAGQFGKVTFTFKGEYSSVTDASMPSPTFAVTNPPVVESATFTVSGSSPITSKVEIDAGVDVQMIDNVSSTNAVYGFFVAGRKPVGSFDPVSDTIANRDDFTRLINNNEMSASVIIGSTTGNIVEVTCPQAQYTDVTYTDTNGLQRHQIPLRFNGNDNSIQIKLR